MTKKTSETLNLDILENENFQKLIKKFRQKNCQIFELISLRNLTLNSGDDKKNVRLNT